MLPGVLSDLLNFAVLDAGRADVKVPVALAGNGPDALQVEVPAALRHIMGVADAVTELGSTSAYVTYFRHSKFAP